MLYTVEDVVECTHWPLIGQAGSIDIKVSMDFIPHLTLINKITESIDRLDHSVISADPDIVEFTQRYTLLDGFSELFLVDAMDSYTPLLIDILKKELSPERLDNSVFTVEIKLNKQSLKEIIILDKVSRIIKNSA